MSQTRSSCDALDTSKHAFADGDRVTLASKVTSDGIPNLAIGTPTAGD
jgi:hypothetical protein